jgi:alkanesulfonate monooxygenase SsuD/methylene tetrahydromethanopterin reductase-like flavin-dependent oxidoreductase (luciferase family)
MNNIIQTIRHTARAAAVLLLALCAAQTARVRPVVTVTIAKE